MTEPNEQKWGRRGQEVWTRTGEFVFKLVHVPKGTIDRVVDARTDGRMIMDMDYMLCLMGLRWETEEAFPGTGWIVKANNGERDFVICACGLKHEANRICADHNFALDNAAFVAMKDEMMRVVQDMADADTGLAEIQYARDLLACIEKG